MNHSENAHQWANKGKKVSSSNSNIKYWDFETVYSYGGHFILAKRIEFEGKEYVFLNTNSYSNSTSKHQGHVKYACLHLDTFSIPFPRNNYFGVESIEQVIKKSVETANKLFKEQLRARSHTYAHQTAQNYLNTAFRLNDLFKVGIDLNSLIDRENQTASALKVIELDSTRQQKAQQKREKLASLERENLTKWLNNEYNGQLYNLPVYLRFNSDKSIIQTSHGANVPTKEAFILLDKLRNGQDCKGYKIGNYTLIESTLDHVKIGCHVIQWEIINNFFNV